MISGGSESISNDDPRMVPGELLALLDDVSDLQKGFYMVDHTTEGWVILRPVEDDERNDTLRIGEGLLHLPLEALTLFMTVGINLATM